MFLLAGCVGGILDNLGYVEINILPVFILLAELGFNTAEFVDRGIVEVAKTLASNLDVPVVGDVRPPGLFLLVVVTVRATGA